MRYVWLESREFLSTFFLYIFLRKSLIFTDVYSIVCVLCIAAESVEAEAVVNGQ